VCVRQRLAHQARRLRDLTRLFFVRTRAVHLLFIPPLPSREREPQTASPTLPPKKRHQPPLLRYRDAFRSCRRTLTSGRDTQAERVTGPILPGELTKMMSWDRRQARSTRDNGCVPIQTGGGAIAHLPGSQGERSWLIECCSREQLSAALRNHPGRRTPASNSSTAVQVTTPGRSGPGE
jgi:hypothetical protein